MISTFLLLIALIAACKTLLLFSQEVVPLAGNDVSVRWFKNKAEIRIPGELRIVNEGEAALHNIAGRANKIDVHRLR